VAGLADTLAEHRGENPCAAIQVPGNRSFGQLSPLRDKTAVHPCCIAVGLPERRHRHPPDSCVDPLRRLVAAFDDARRRAPADARAGLHDVTLPVVVERHMQVCASRPDVVTQAIECTHRQLSAAQVGDQLRAVVPVKAGVAVGGGVEPDPCAPPRRLTGANGFGGRIGLVAPVKSTQLGQLICHHSTLEPARRLGRGECKIATACPVDARDRTQWVDPIR
jgi:hypothetical protein